MSRGCAVEGVDEQLVELVELSLYLERVGNLRVVPRGERECWMSAWDRSRRWPDACCHFLNFSRRFVVRSYKSGRSPSVAL
jgi:hypothetical protein